MAGGRRVQLEESEEGCRLDKIGRREDWRRAEDTEDQELLELGKQTG